MSTHISQFYACTEVKSYAELQYIIELGKQLFYRGQGGLSINGITISKELENCKYWDYFVMANRVGWLVNYSGRLEQGFYDLGDIDNVFIIEYKTEPPKAYVEDNSDTKPRLDYVYLKHENNDVWEWTIRGSEALQVNSLSLGKLKQDMAWIAFVAYVAVHRMLNNNVPETLLVALSDSVVSRPYVLSNFINLIEDTQCIDWLKYSTDITVSKESEMQMNYMAWFHRGVIEGVAQKSYTPEEKKQHLKDLGFIEGDMAFLYVRKVSVQGAMVNNIKSFYPIIIDKITKDGINYIKVNNRRTKAQVILDYKDYSSKTKSMYGFNNTHLKKNESRGSLRWCDMGVEYFIDTEEFLVTPCYADDELPTVIEDKDGDIVEVIMSATDRLYWILKEYGYIFNEERYLERYFKHSKTLWEEYH